MRGKKFSLVYIFGKRGRKGGPSIFGKDKEKTRYKVQIRPSLGLSERYRGKIPGAPPTFFDTQLLKSLIPQAKKERKNEKVSDFSKTPPFPRPPPPKTLNSDSSSAPSPPACQNTEPPLLLLPLT